MELLSYYLPIPGETASQPLTSVNFSILFLAMLAYIFLLFYLCHCVSKFIFVYLTYSSTASQPLTSITFSILFLACILLLFLIIYLFLYRCVSKFVYLTYLSIPHMKLAYCHTTSLCRGRLLPNRLPPLSFLFSSWHIVYV